MRFTNVCTGCLLAGAAIVVAACGGGSSRAHQNLRPPGSKVVDVYSSLPMRGASATAALALANGIKLALEQDHGRAGRWVIHYTALDDSGPGGGWDAARTAANARKVAADPNAVYYIGEFDSAATQISVPVLNQADVPQVSPTSTYIGLTTGLPGSHPGAREPGVYYPTTIRTFLRLMPIDTVQAGALLDAMKQAGCTRAAVADDGSAYGADLAKLVAIEKSGYGVQIVSSGAVPPDERRYAQTIRPLTPDCFLYAGNDAAAAVRITSEVNAVLPTAKIFGSDRICSSAWTGGLPTRMDRLIECTMPTLPLTAYRGGSAFLAAYRAAFGASDPNAYALYGYEAMKLGLDTIRRLGARGDSKSEVRAALFATRARHSALGIYGFDSGGDTTLRSYGLYRVGPGGDPTFVGTLSPPKTV